MTLLKVLTWVGVLAAWSGAIYIWWDIFRENRARKRRPVHFQPSTQVRRVVCGHQNWWIATAKPTQVTCLNCILEMAPPTKH